VRPRSGRTERLCLGNRSAQMRTEIKNDLVAALRDIEISQWLVDLAAPIGGWKIFHTATFDPGSFDRHGKPARSPWVALKRYRSFMQECDRRKVTWVVGVEPNPDHHWLNPGFHCHAMWAMTDEVWRTASFKRWANQWGNNKVDPVRIAGHVQRYVAKYCLKAGAVWDLQINDREIFLQQQLRIGGARRNNDQAKAALENSPV
jgi:hypothetical protein